MIKIHLNGDIVRGPDIAEIHRRASEIRDKHRICKYNVHENQCPSWMQVIRSAKQSGRCILAGTDKCYGHCLRASHGREEKNFRIDNVNYRKLASAAHYLVKKSKYKTLFITLTFPKFKRDVTETELNQAFSKFAENLRENYNCTGYVGVRERGKLNNRYHYHLLISVPYIPFATLNDTWLHTIKDFCWQSKNAVTSDKKTLFIKQPGRALKYCCKYFAKAKNSVSKTRLIFISNNLIREPRPFDNKNCEYYTFNDLLNDYKTIKGTKVSDFTTAYRIQDAKEFDVFCEKVLYKLFNLGQFSSELYSFHPS